MPEQTIVQNPQDTKNTNCQNCALLAAELAEAYDILRSIRIQAESESNLSRDLMADGGMGKTEWGFHKGVLESSATTLELIGVNSDEEVTTWTRFTKLFS